MRVVATLDRGEELCELAHVDLELVDQMVLVRDRQEELLQRGPLCNLFLQKQFKTRKENSKDQYVAIGKQVKAPVGESQEKGRHVCGQVRRQVRVRQAAMRGLVSREVGPLAALVARLALAQVDLGLQPRLWVGRGEKIIWVASFGRCPVPLCPCPSCRLGPRRDEDCRAALS